LWIREYPADSDAAAHYLVLGATGAVRARVLMPNRDIVRSVSGNRIVAVHTDDDGVQSVRIYSIVRR
jgi:hypothetical protein